MTPELYQYSKVLLGYSEVGIKPPEARFLISCQAS
nr:MAG TPA: hypothetical protein [Bacteriophage sp.]